MKQILVSSTRRIKFWHLLYILRYDDDDYGDDDDDDNDDGGDDDDDDEDDEEIIPAFLGRLTPFVKECLQGSLCQARS